VKHNSNYNRRKDKVKNRIFGRNKESEKEQYINGSIGIAGNASALELQVLW